MFIKIWSKGLKWSTFSYFKDRLFLTVFFILVQDWIAGNIIFSTTLRGAPALPSIQNWVNNDQLKQKVWLQKGKSPSGTKWTGPRSLWTLGLSVQTSQTLTHLRLPPLFLLVPACLPQPAHRRQGSMCVWFTAWKKRLLLRNYKQEDGHIHQTPPPSFCHQTHTVHKSLGFAYSCSPVQQWQFPATGVPMSRLCVKTQKPKNRRSHGLTQPSLTQLDKPVHNLNFLRS